ncbi:hypothetical protein J6590_074531 [Homalodisca vitripennis]|nr:hypothetical protein J6590_074531 [Homalodisca vitripennis]
MLESQLGVPITASAKVLKAKSTASAAVSASNKKQAQASDWFLKNGLVLNPAQTGFIGFSIHKIPSSHIFLGCGFTFNNNCKVCLPPNFSGCIWMLILAGNLM